VVARPRNSRATLHQRRIRHRDGVSSATPDDGRPAELSKFDTTARLFFLEDAQRGQFFFGFDLTLRQVIVSSPVLTRKPRKPRPSRHVA
jgi:hypothetical protein